MFFLEKIEKQSNFPDLDHNKAKSAWGEQIKISMLSRCKLFTLAFSLLLFGYLGINLSQAQCTAVIANGNGSFNDNQIGWSSPTAGATVQSTPAPEGSSSDGGAYLRPFTTGDDELVNISLDGLTTGGIYIVEWEAIHGLAATSSNYPNGITYTVNILDGSTLVLSQDYLIDDAANWVAQSLTFTSSNANLIFQISLEASNFTSGTYKMGIDGMSITCNGTNRPCDLQAPTFIRSN